VSGNSLRVIREVGGLALSEMSLHFIAQQEQELTEISSSRAPDPQAKTR